MIPFTKQPESVNNFGNKSIANFSADGGNLDANTVESFGDEWNRFSDFSELDLERAGSQYFDLIDDYMINTQSVALDVGCGSGRWSKYIAKRVKFIEAIDPSNAVFAAARLLQNEANIRITRAAVNDLPFANGSFDFVFSLGVLHHIPDTSAAIKKAAEKL